MAKAVKKIQKMDFPPDMKRKQDLEEIETALLDNKEAVLETLQAVGYLHERGALALANGLLGQFDKVLHILMKTADTPETANTLKNLLLMVGMLGSLDVKQLEPIILKVNAGIARVAEQNDTEEKTSYFGAVRSLKDPEINRSVTLLLNFLKGMGEATSHKERTTKEPHDQLAEERESK